MKALKYGPVAAALLLAGCAAPPLPAVTYDKTANSIHAITLVTPYITPQPTLLQGQLNAAMSETPMIGGAVAGLIIGGIELHHQDEFAAVIQAQGFQAQQILIADLTSALTAKGYAVTYLPAARPNEKFLTSYPAAQTDAYLDISVQSYGYGQAGYQPYDPILAAQYKLVRAKDNQIVMQNTVGYSGSAFAYQFGSVADFGKDPQRTVAGLKEEMSEVSTAISGGLQ